MPEATALRHDWTRDEALNLFATPFNDLLFDAQNTHRSIFDPNLVQISTLLSIKTGACPEDCKYCPQSAHYAKKTGLQREKLMDVDTVLDAARAAQAKGSTRFCMGAAWREVREGPEFDNVVEMVRGVTGLGMEACVTLGMLNENQATRLADAGLKAYNHNLDTSPEYYDQIITTRTYQDRLDTIANVRAAGITVCSGGIIGMGESEWDRARMLQVLAGLDPHPESVPINALVAVPGTPLENNAPVDPLDLVRMIATARIIMPASRVRLSAGRHRLSKEAQVLCFMAGANSFFYGDKLLTTDNADSDEDLELIADAGLTREQVG